MTGAGKVNANNLQPNQPSCLAALSLAASHEMNHSPLTTHHSLKRKSAFPLAEVLIALAIIGVVVALTLPTLIANYQDISHWWVGPKNCSTKNSGSWYSGGSCATWLIKRGNTDYLHRDLTTEE